MLADAVRLAAQVTQAIASVASAQQWEAVQQVLAGIHDEIDGQPQVSGRSRKVHELREEVASVATTLSRPSDLIDGRNRRLLLQACQDRWQSLLEMDPDLASEFKAILAAVDSIDDCIAKNRGKRVSVDWLQLTEATSNQLAISPWICVTEDRESERSESSLPARSAELPLPVIAGTHMEFSGERAATVHGNNLERRSSIVWDAVSLSRLIEAPYELLPERLYGRDELLTVLRAALEEPGGKIYRICGDAGVGKSTVALALADIARSKSMDVWWVRGNPELIDACMTAIAVQLHAEPSELAEARAGRRNLADLVWALLEKSPRRWLLVVDDVADYSALQRMFSHPVEHTSWIRNAQRGMVVVTTRQATESGSRHFENHFVGPLDVSSASALLSETVRDGGTLEEARELAIHLGSLPLSCMLASKHMRATGAEEHTFARYLAKLKSFQTENFAENSAVYDYLRHIVDSIRKPESEDAWALLAVMSYCASATPLPIHLLEFSGLRKCGFFASTGKSETRSTVWRHLDLLNSLGLAETARTPSRRNTGKSDVGYVYVHPLVSQTCRSLIESDFGDSVRSRVWIGVSSLLHLATRRQIDRDDWNWAEISELSPHVAALVLNLPESTPSRAIEETLQAVRATLEYLAVSGGYQSAEQLGRRALHLSRSLAEDNEASLGLTYELARIVMERGRLGEARKLFERVLEVRQRTLGLDHRETLDVMEQLASLLHRQGGLKEAEHMLRQVVQGRERIFGVNDPARTRALNTLGQVLSRQGKLGETERISRSLVDTLQGSYGAMSRQTLEAEAILAATLRALGELDEARKILERVFEKQRLILGTEHVDTLNTAVGLAETLRDLGYLEHAERVFEQVLDMRRNILGSDHPDTLTTLAELAETQRDLGKLDAAMESVKSALIGRYRVLGPEHPDTLDSNLGLAVILRDLGQLSEAEHILRRLVQSYSSSRGEDDPVTLSALHNLAAVLQDAGQLEEASAIYQDLLDRREWTLGPNHPETLRTMVNLGSLLHRRGALDEAQHMFSQANEAYHDIFGPSHPHTLTVKNNMANVLLDLGMPIEAEALYRDVLEVQTRVLGNRHPDTLITRTNLAVALTEVGSLSEAGSLLKDTISNYESFIDQGHPILLATRAQLAMLQERRGDLAAALEIYSDILSQQEEMLGVGHPDVISTRLSVSRVLRRLGRMDESSSEYREVIKRAVTERARFSKGRRYSSRGNLLPTQEAT